MPGLVGLFMVAAVNPEPVGDRRGSRTVILGLRTAKVVVVAGVVAAAFWVVTEDWRPTGRSPRAERSMSSTEAMSASVRIGKTGKKELLQRHSAAT